jgi:hypothetical protein
MSDKYILEGRVPVLCTDAVQWEKWCQNIANRRIALTQLAENVRVATLFLGVDYNSEGPPLLFETMICGGAHSGFERQYSTYDEAEAGHKLAVVLAGAGIRAEEDLTWPRMIRFYRREYTAMYVVGPLIRRIGFRFSWTSRASQKWRYRLLRCIFNPTAANFYAGYRGGGPRTPYA